MNKFKILLCDQNTIKAHRENSYQNIYIAVSHLIKTVMNVQIIQMYVSTLQSVNLIYPVFIFSCLNPIKTIQNLSCIASRLDFRGEKCATIKSQDK